MAINVKCGDSVTGLTGPTVQPSQERESLFQNFQKDGRTIGNEALKRDNGPEMPALTSQSVRTLEVGSSNEIFNMLRTAIPPALLYMRDQYNQAHPDVPLRDHLAERGLTDAEIKIVERRIEFAERYSLKPPPL